jgi:hypothetical protein
MVMEAKFIPDSDSLKNTDWKNPSLEKNNKKSILLLLLCVGMLAVVFIPWFCLGIDVEDIGSVKLRAFGFQTWYGIIAGVVALVAIVGVIYRHYSLTLCSSVLALFVSFFALSDYPASRLSVNVSDEFEAILRENARHEREYFDDYYEDYGDYNFSSNVALKVINMYDEVADLKVPGQIVELVSIAFDIVDQRFVYDVLNISGAGREIHNEVGDVNIMNHRLGAILYLAFAALAAIFSYIAIAGSCCGKKESTPQTVE